MELDRLELGDDVLRDLDAMNLVTGTSELFLEQVADPSQVSPHGADQANDEFAIELVMLMDRIGWPGR